MRCDGAPVAAFLLESIAWLVAAFQTMTRMRACQSSARGIESGGERRYADLASMRKPLPLASQLERGCSNETFLQQYRTGTSQGNRRRSSASNRKVEPAVEAI